MSEDSKEPFFVVRKRAAITGTAFDFIRVGVHCPQCHKDSLQPLAELVANDDTACSYCGACINLLSHRRKAELLKLADEYKQIKPM